jgi:hypothetical protein
MMAAFIVKHFICDFLPQIQTPAMVQNKGTYGHPAGIAHSFVHVSASCFVLWIFSWGYSGSTDFLIFATTFFGVLAFEGLVHYHMDWFKMWWGKKKGYTPAQDKFWIWLGIDQMVHYMTYVVMVLVWM